MNPKENDAERAGVSRTVHENFFRELKKRNISSKKYAEDNFIDSSLPSKWKTGKSSMTVEQIYQAAEYLNITVNELYYDEDKKREIAVLSEGEYRPLPADRLFSVKRYDIFCAGKNRFLIFLLAFTAGLGLLGCLYAGKYPNFFWFSALGALLSVVFFMLTNCPKDVFHIGCLDKIYFFRAEETTRPPVLMFLSWLFAFLFSCVSFVLFLFAPDFDDGMNSQFVFTFICSMILPASFFAAGISFPIRWPGRTDEGVFFALSFSFCLTVAMWMQTCHMLFFSFAASPLYLLVTAVSLSAASLSTLWFFLLKKFLSSYALMYKEYKKQAKKFPKNMH